MLWEASPKGLQESRAPFRHVPARHLANARTVAAWLRDNPDVNPALFHAVWFRWLAARTREDIRARKLSTESRESNL